MKRLTAFDCLGRGIANVRGNAESILVFAVGSLALFVLVGFSLSPWMAALGIRPEALSGAATSAVDFEQLGRTLFVSGPLLPRIVVFLVTLGVVLTVAAIFFSWYFGGLLGVLYAGDAQAPPGGGRPPVLFRTYSRSYFLGEARRLVWKLFWFYNVFLGVWLLLLLLLMTLAVAIAYLANRSGGLAGMAMGCGAMLPTIFVMFVAIAATELGQSLLPDREVGVLAAGRAALRTLGARFGATLGLIVLAIIASLAVGLFASGSTVVAELALGSRPAALWSARIAIFLVQISVSAVVNLVGAAAFVALARSEHALELERTSREATA